MVYSLQTCSYWFFEKIVSATVPAPAFSTSIPPSTPNMWEYEWALVCVRERCMWLLVFVSINVREYEQSLQACWCEGEKASSARLRESKWRPQVYAVSVLLSEHTVSQSSHQRTEQQRDPPIGCHPTPLPTHTHIQRQWLLLSETEMHYVLSLTLSMTYSHKTARMNTQLHWDTSETVCLNQRHWTNTTHWVAQIYTWYLLSSRSVEFRCWWVVHSDSDFSH